MRGGVDEQIWEVVARVAKKNGSAVEPVVITGTASPNEALNNGDLEANAFQHIPFLKDQIKQRGYKLVPVANTLISPIAFYSKKYKSLQDLPPGAKVGIPNDPSNQTRAGGAARPGTDHAQGRLRSVHRHGHAGRRDVQPQETGVRRERLGGAGALAAGRGHGGHRQQLRLPGRLIATRDGIAVEKKENNPYVNIIVVREQDKNAPWVPELVKAYHSEEVRQFILSKYEGSVIPVF